jgi:hypothetical protein
MSNIKMIGIFPRSIAFAAILTGILLFSCGDLFVWNGDPDPPINVLTAKDSLAVRAILDANGLYDKEVRDVINLQSSMVGTINLDSLAITKFVFTNAIDTFIHGLSINIFDSPIDTLIIMDTIHIDFSIGINRTNLRSIPDNVSLFKGNMYMYLGNNQIQYISPEIMKCDIGFFDIQNNRLCSVPDSLSNWIMSKRPNSKNWQSTQRCSVSMN